MLRGVPCVSLQVDSYTRCRSSVLLLSVPSYGPSVLTDGTLTAQRGR